MFNVQCSMFIAARDMSTGAAGLIRLPVLYPFLCCRFILFIFQSERYWVNWKYILQRILEMKSERKQLQKSFAIISDFCIPLITCAEYFWFFQLIFSLKLKSRCKMTRYQWNKKRWKVDLYQVNSRDDFLTTSCRPQHLILLMFSRRLQNFTRK